jgi:hypothetical protein
VDIIYKDGSLIILKNVLYILRLGVNLISSRYIYEIRNLKGLFDLQSIYFKLGKKRVITTKIHDRLYIVTYITKDFRETAFYAKIDNEISESYRARYLLFYRRFIYLGPDKIRNLYKVIILNKVIYILNNKEIY